jgi:hypothetical protein
MVSWIVVVLPVIAAAAGDTAVTVSEWTPACAGVEVSTVKVLVPVP